MVQLFVFIWSRLPWATAFAIKNAGIVAGIVEQIIKILVQIVQLTPSRKDDEVMSQVDELFDKVQGWFYATAQKISDWYSKFKGIVK